jgi:hypothetical protein
LIDAWAQVFGERELGEHPTAHRWPATLGAATLFTLERDRGSEEAAWLEQSADLQGARESPPIADYFERKAGIDAFFALLG